MMSGKYLLDTNIIIALFANEQNILGHLQMASEVFIPSIVIGELYFGAYKAIHTVKNIQRINEFVTNNVILGCDTETAYHYGQIKANLRSKGKPLPENDIWIASIAKQHQLILVTRDTHFNEIENLQTNFW
jgi:tRNA(fMet)-specific endonuclease VapC